MFFELGLLMEDVKEEIFKKPILEGFRGCGAVKLSIQIRPNKRPIYAKKKT